MRTLTPEVKLEWRRHGMPGFQSFWGAQHTLAGIEVMPMIQKGRLECGGETHTPAAPVDALAA
jgi:hypothetical protein